MRFVLLQAALLLPMRAALAAPQIFASSAGELKVETVAGGLVHPGSLAFSPDGRMLVSERPGRLRIVTRGGQLSPPLAGVPNVYAQSQAGLMDVLLGEDFAKNRTVYFCYAEPAEGGGGRIAVARGQLEENGRTPRLVAVTTIFRQRGPASHGLNIGCRMAQASDGNLFVTLGDHFSAAEMAQLGDLCGSPRQQCCEPGPVLCAMDLGIADNGERAGDEQAAQIPVASFRRCCRAGLCSRSSVALAGLPIQAEKLGPDRKALRSASVATRGGWLDRCQAMIRRSNCRI